MKRAADKSGKVMCWKGHSMGCYLLLNMVDRLRWKGEDMRAMFGRVILDAPDVPTWFFSSMTKVKQDNWCASNNPLSFLGRLVLSVCGDQRR